MRVTTSTEPAPASGADTVAVGIFAGKGVAHDVDDGALQALVDRGEAKATPRHLAVTHAAGTRWILVGLGAREEFDAERARAVAAAVVGRARELGTRSLCWEVPHHSDDRVLAGLVEGTLLSAYRFDRYKRSGGADDEDDGARDGLRELVLSDHRDRAAAARAATVVAEAVNRARDLQNTP